MNMPNMPNTKSKTKNRKKIELSVYLKMINIVREVGIKITLINFELELQVFEDRSKLRTCHSL